MSMPRAQVRICRERATGKIFAMKKLQKSEMVRRGQVDHVKAERNVLTEVRRAVPCHSPHWPQDSVYCSLLLPGAVLTRTMAGAGVQPVRREAPLLFSGAPHVWFCVKYTSQGTRDVQQYTVTSPWLCRTTTACT